MEKVKVIEIKKSVFAENDKDADDLRKELKTKGVSGNQQYCCLIV